MLEKIGTKHFDHFFVFAEDLQHGISGPDIPCGGVEGPSLIPCKVSDQSESVDGFVCRNWYRVDKGDEGEACAKGTTKGSWEFEEGGRGRRRERIVAIVVMMMMMIRNPITTEGRTKGCAFCFLMISNVRNVYALPLPNVKEMNEVDGKKARAVTSTSGTFVHSQNGDTGLLWSLKEQVTP